MKHHAMFLVIGSMSLASCGKFEIENATSSPVSIAIGGEHQFDPGAENPPKRFELSAGDTRRVSVNVPLTDKSGRIVAIGDFVNLDTLVPTGGDTFSIVENAGIVVITNTSSSVLDPVQIQREANLPEEWIFGFGDWGPDYGPLPPGQSVEVTALPPGDDYLVLFGNSIRLDYQTVSVGEITTLDLQ